MFFVDVQSPAPNVAVFKLEWKVGVPLTTTWRPAIPSSLPKTLVSKSIFTGPYFQPAGGGVDQLTGPPQILPSFNLTILNLHRLRVHVGDIADEMAERGFRHKWIWQPPKCDSMSFRTLIQTQAAALIPTWILVFYVSGSSFMDF